jgi:hypothetical protein
MSFWDIIWFIFISFAFIAYLMVLFSIIGDLFRDDSSGWVKAVWVVLLIVFPLITSVVYLIAKGPGMAERQNRAARGMRAQQEAYIKSVAGGGGGSAGDQIAQAKGLLDSGAITQAEFDTLKAKALA